ncbi:hypothetical protein AB0C07_22275 [Actinoplanes missouriensis]|uniref:hypothetical protein n=1 Tax=Actinoplanes missouriensis TaxID=1866 RepID=UPI0033EB9D5E
MRARWVVAAAVAMVAVVGGVVGWLVVRSDEGGERERRYRAEAACLLTDADGIRGAVAAPIWAGMQRASLETRVQVSFLAVNGAQTVPNAVGYLGGLLQGHCDLLVAVGTAPAGAVTEVAAKYPQQRFAVVGGAAAGNVEGLGEGEAAVYELLTTALTE